MKTTDEKILELVKTALKEGSVEALFMLSDLLNKRAHFENKLNELISSREGK